MGNGPGKGPAPRAGELEIIQDVSADRRSGLPGHLLRHRNVDRRQRLQIPIRRLGVPQPIMDQGPAGNRLDEPWVQLQGVVQKGQATMRSISPPGAR